ncbi:MAG: Mur ligase family protein [bacterium]|nr:Mur ligase family protein [bacterium]
MQNSPIQKIKNIFHLFQAIIANIVYGFPGRKIKIIGITGTDGKTTTTHLIYHILKNAGKKVSMISTVYAKIGDKEYDIGFHVTTPDIFPLQKFLKESVKNGDEFFVLETTSHALDQHRIFGIPFEVSVITNVTHEHLDYHKTYDNYVKTKAKLLLSSKYSIINSDDRSVALLDKILKSHEKKYFSVGFKHKSDFHLSYLKKVLGYNKYNYLSAYSVTTLLNIPEKIIVKAMDTFKLPAGRLETVYKKDFIVIIDFAHTPNAFKEVLPLIRKEYLKNKGKLIHVFGAASQRDSTKRPFMGKYSDQFSDLTILTEEDCRQEDPNKICNEIAQGISHKDKYQIITDRQDAINKAILLAQKGDVVVLTGKSHEKSLCRGKKEYPWSEHEAVKKALSYK